LIHIVTPYRTDKNLGRAYNEAFERCPDGDWLCLTDIDTMLLTPTAPLLMQKYTETLPEAVFTCWTNRISVLATEQLYGGKVSEIDSIRQHMIIANGLESQPLHATLLRRGEMSGFLMLMSKETWKKCPAPEYMDKGGCIGVDTWWTRAMVRQGIPLMRMDNIYVWHTYRLLNGVRDKSHLNA
jgi:hypothetical protein